MKRAGAAQASSGDVLHMPPPRHLQAGIKSPHELAMADEDAITRALSACFAQQLKRRAKNSGGQPGKQQKQHQRPSGKEAAADGMAAVGAAAMAARAARALVAASRQLVTASNRQLESLAAQVRQHSTPSQAFLLRHGLNRANRSDGLDHATSTCAPPKPLMIAGGAGGAQAVLAC